MRTIETRFSTGITKYEPRRRRWARPALMMLLAAVVLWLMSGCTAGSGDELLTWDDLPKWLRGSLMGLGSFVIIGLTWAAALKVKRDDEAAMARSRGLPQRGAKNEAWEDEEDPLDLPYAGLDMTSMIRITDALLKHTEGAAGWVESARNTLCRHEQEDMLRMALRDLQPVNACLPELKKALKVLDGRAVL